MARSSEQICEPALSRLANSSIALLDTMLIVACGQHQAPARGARSANPSLSTARHGRQAPPCTQPMVGAPDGELGSRLEHRQIAHEALVVAGQRIALERSGRRRIPSCRPAPRSLPNPISDNPVAIRRHRGRRHRQARDLHHRRGQHHAREPAAALGRGLEQHRRRHGVGKRVIRGRDNPAAPPRS